MVQDLSLDELDVVLGNPVSQKLLRLLTCWPSLPVAELVSKSRLDPKLVHHALGQLVRSDILHEISSGVYAIFINSFTKPLQEAYRAKLLEFINAELYTIQQLLKKGDRTASNRFRALLEQYKPVLEESFVMQMNSIAHQAIDSLGA